MAEYSEGKWKVNKIGFDWVIMVYDDAGKMVSSGVATCGGEGDAQLIVSAVNMCISLNKENPLAVAEGMGELIKELQHQPQNKLVKKALEDWLNSPNIYLGYDKGYGKGKSIDTLANEICQLLKPKVLASIERGK